MGRGGKHVKMRMWTPSEDEQLLSHLDLHRNSWTTLSAAMADRTPAQCRNRYIRIQKGIAKVEDHKAKNRCRKCGLLRMGHICTGTPSEGAPQPPLAKAARSRPAPTLGASHPSTGASLPSVPVGIGTSQERPSVGRGPAVRGKQSVETSERDVEIRFARDGAPQLLGEGTFNAGNFDGEIWPY